MAKSSGWNLQTTRLLGRLGLVALVALLLTVLEWVSLNLSIQLHGDAVSELSLVCSLFAGYFFCAALGSLLARGLEVLWRRAPVHGVPWLRLTLIAVLCSVCLRRLDTWAAGFYMEEFPDRLALAMGAARVGVIAVVAGSIDLVCRALLPYTTRLSRLLHMLFWLACLLGCMVLMRRSIAAVHIMVFAPVIAVLTVLCACFCVRQLPEQPLRAYRVAGVVSVALLLLAPFSAFRNHYARAVTFEHCPTAATLFAPLRDLLDVDGDGSVAVALGGEDCAPFDTLRGPLELETLGDGIDQDCRGGDAPVLVTPDPALGSREKLLAALGPCTLPAGPLSLLVLTVDALRADAVNNMITPNLERFAAAAQTFTRAYSPSTNTRRALGSVFSGKTTSDFGSPNVQRVDSLNIGTPWVVRFSEAGYYTTGLNFLYTLEPVKRAFHRFNQTTPDDVQPDDAKYAVTSAAMNRAVLAQFERGLKQPFFMWAHYPDPHAPYHDDTVAPGLPPMLKGYLREVAYTDFHLGHLLQTLEQGKIFEQTIVVISADHGEELGQRGIEGHGPLAFESVIHVPLMIRIPGCAPKRFEHPVSTVDLLANMALLVGIVPSARLLTSVEDARHVVSEVWPAGFGFLRVVMDGDIKMIVDVSNGGRLLFDLREDPVESRDLYRSRPDLAQRLEQRYQQWLDHPGAR